MIRVDLGKNELEKISGAAKPADQVIEKLHTKLPKQLSFVFKPTEQKTTAINLNAVLLLGVAVLLGYFPSFMFERYRAGVVSKFRAQEKTLVQGINDLDQRIVKLSPYKAELESYEKQKQIVLQRLEVVQNLLAARGTPIPILDTIGQSLPRRAWLRRVVFKQEPVTAPTVEIEGSSFSNEEISTYVDRLSESVYLSQVGLNLVTPGKHENKIDVKQFKIEVAGLAPVVAKAPPEDKKAVKAKQRNLANAKKKPKE